SDLSASVSKSRTRALHDLFVRRLLVLNACKHPPCLICVSIHIGYIVIITLWSVKVKQKRSANNPDLSLSSFPDNEQVKTIFSIVPPTHRCFALKDIDASFTSSRYGRNDSRFRLESC